MLTANKPIQAICCKCERELSGDEIMLVAIQPGVYLEKCPCGGDVDLPFYHMLKKESPEFRKAVEPNERVIKEAEKRAYANGAKPFSASLGAYYGIQKFPPFNSMHS